MAISPTQSLDGQDYFTTTLNGAVALSDTVINLNAVPTASEGFLVIDPNNASTREIIYYNSKTSGSVTCPDATQGSARGVGGTTAQAHASNTAVEMRNVWEYIKYLQSGASNTGMQQYQDESTFDFVQTGLVWTGDALGSTRAASMTSGTVYIDGRRMTLSAVTGRTFTASKDTYVDILRTGNVASVVYTEVTNNAASPALASNSIRIAIVVTGATTIAAAGSINQGDPYAVLPIASSVAYSVSDSLGNLICNRNPSPTVIGSRQIVTNFTTTATSATQVTGLSVPVIVPANRKVKITFHAPSVVSPTVNDDVETSIWDGTVGTTRLAHQYLRQGVSNQQIGPVVIAWPPPTSGSKTYNVALHSATGATKTLTGEATSPAIVEVSLV